MKKNVIFSLIFIFVKMGYCADDCSRMAAYTSLSNDAEEVLVVEGIKISSEWRMEVDFTNSLERLMKKIPNGRTVRRIRYTTAQLGVESDAVLQKEMHDFVLKESPQKYKSLLSHKWEGRKMLHTYHYSLHKAIIGSSSVEKIDSALRKYGLNHVLCMHEKESFLKPQNKFTFVLNLDCRSEDGSMAVGTLSGR